MNEVGPRIVLGVTSPMSLTLMKGLPERLADDGWDVNVVSAPGTVLEALGQEGRVHVHAIPMSREPNLAGDIVALWRWWRYLGRVNPDILLVGTPKAGMLGILAGWLSRVPVRIYHLRGLRLETARGVGRIVFRAVEVLTLFGATSTIAVSQSLKQRVSTLRLGRQSKIVVLGRGSSNGVDLEEFTSAETASAADASTARLALIGKVPVVGFVGRVHPDKGLDTLVAASALLSARAVPHQLLIVGGADHPLAEAILGRLGSLEANVVLTGAVADARPFYRIMDVHCLPTLREGFPNAILEAAASGVASVTTKVTGAMDAVMPGETGFLVEAQNGEALADALQEALSDRDELDRLARNARKWVVANYSRDRVQEALIDYLRRSVRTADVR
ncbi:glycosyltransferase family 4 protein [Microbacterium sp. NPDC089318]